MSVFHCIEVRSYLTGDEKLTAPNVHPVGLVQISEQWPLQDTMSVFIASGTLATQTPGGMSKSLHSRVTIEVVTVRRKGGRIARQVLGQVVAVLHGVYLIVTWAGRVHALADQDLRNGLANTSSTGEGGGNVHLQAPSWQAAVSGPPRRRRRQKQEPRGSW